MQIAGKEYSEILISGSEGNLLANITDENIIHEDGCKVELVPLEVPCGKE